MEESPDSMGGGRLIGPSRLLVGRDGELDWLSDGFDRSRRDGVGFLVLTGAPGIGKSSLLTSFTDRVRGDGVDVVSATWPRTIRDPYGAIRTLARRLVGPGRTAELFAGLDRVGASTSGDSTPDEVAARRAHEYGTIASRLIDELRRRPTVLVLDDLHWTGVLGVELLEFLLDEMDAHRHDAQTLVVLSTRVPPPPHPVAELLDSLLPRLGAGALELLPLDGTASEVIVEQVAGLRPSRAFVNLVLRSARGNPLHVRAAVDALTQRGVGTDLRAGDAAGRDRVAALPDLRDPVRAWIGALPAEVRHVLGSVAVTDSEFTTADAADISHRPADVASSALRQALESELIASGGTTSWFRHALFAEAIVGQLPAGDRRAAHLRAAELDRRKTTPSASRDRRIGMHFEEAGALAPPAERFEAFAAAGAACLALAEWAEAAHYFEAALALPHHGPPRDPQELLVLHGGAGRAHYFDHDHEAALPHLGRAVAAAADAGDEMAHASLIVTAQRIRTATDPDAWRRTDDRRPIDRFLETARSPTARALVLNVLSEAQTTAGDPVEGAHTADLAIAAAHRTGDPVCTSLAVYARAYADMVALRLRESTDGAKEALAQARSGGDWFTESIMGSRLAFPLTGVGELDDAEAMARQAIAIAEHRHEHSGQALGRATLATVAMLRGDYVGAEVEGERAAESARRSAYVLADLFTAPAVFLARLRSGDLEGARAVAEQWPNLAGSARTVFSDLVVAARGGRGGLSDRPRLPPRQVTQVSVGYYAADLEVAMAEGDLDAVVAGVDALAEYVAGGLEHPVSYPVSLTRVRAGLAAALGDHDGAAELYAEAVQRAERSSAATELAMSLAGWAEQMVAAGSPAADVEARATQCLDLADRLGVPGVAVRARRLLPATSVAEVSGAREWRAILITDLAGSTDVSARLGDLAYVRLVVAHHELVRACLQEWDGHEFSESGDGLLAWFADAERAVGAALAVRQRASRLDPGDVTPRIKVGVAYGQPLFHEGRPFGVVLNRAARIVDQASAGEVLLDRATAARVRRRGHDTVPRSVELRGIGPEMVHRLVRP